jgi:RNA polymerase sigma-70 factor, ECF subfamily
LQRIVNIGRNRYVYSLECFAQQDGPNVATEFELQYTFSNRAAVNSPTDSGSADIALVKAAQNGDRGAFGMLYARYSRMVHGILLSQVPHPAVEDLLQDVFLQALPRLNSLRDVSRFGGWLAAIARNRATDFHRQSRPASQFNEEFHSEGQGPHPASHCHQSEAHQILEAIRSLPVAYRETLILRFVEGMTGPEIAARTGLTHGSVRVNLHRGMQQLRALVGNKAAGPDSQASSAQS